MTNKTNKSGRNAFARRALVIALICILGLVAACDNGSTSTTVVTYNIGDTGPGGGKIFYVGLFTDTSTGNTYHYLEAAPINQGTKDLDGLAWASLAFVSTAISGMDNTGTLNTTDTPIGAGRKNNALILATDATAPAALACKNYNGGGKTDWFLPSKDELNEFYKQRAIFGIGNPAEVYWSSSQNNNGIAWDQLFSNGDQDYLSKANQLSVRAIWAF